MDLHEDLLGGVLKFGNLEMFTWSIVSTFVLSISQNARSVWPPIFGRHKNMKMVMQSIDLDRSLGFWLHSFVRSCFPFEGMFSNESALADCTVRRGKVGWFVPTVKAYAHARQISKQRTHQDAARDAKRLANRTAPQLPAANSTGLCEKIVARQSWRRRRRLEGHVQACYCFLMVT